MRINKSLRADQEIIKRFLDVLGGGSVSLSGNNLAQPDFFISAHHFIHEYIENGLFKKEELMIRALESHGFPVDSGPISALRKNQQKGFDTARQISASANLWRVGDQIARSELGWAVSEFNSAMREHLERIRNLLIPLIEQTLPIDDEQKLGDEVNKVLPTASKSEQDKFIEKIIALEEELSDWR